MTGELSLILVDTTDNQEVTLPVTDLNTSGLYFNLAVALPESVAAGEHQYRLMSGLIPLSCGLLFVTEEDNSKEYEKEITYDQYESE